MQPLEAKIHYRHANGRFKIQLIFNKPYELAACSDPLLARQLPRNVKEGDVKTVFLKSPTASMTLFKFHSGIRTYLAPLFLYNKENSDSGLIVVTKPDIPPFRLNWLVFDYLDGCFIVYADNGKIYVNKHAPAKAAKIDYPVISDLSLLFQFVCRTISETDMLAGTRTHKESEPIRVTTEEKDTNMTEQTETPEHAADKRVRYFVHVLLHKLVASLDGVRLKLAQPRFKKKSFNEALSNSKSFLDRYDLPKLENNGDSKVEYLEKKSNSSDAS
ncbi:hypothetical protein IIB51_00315 [Patescibacteria group bacterium]|nr:hypothetical protein [Patescibacteria group bacterium]